MLLLSRAELSIITRSHLDNRVEVTGNFERLKAHEAATRAKRTKMQICLCIFMLLTTCPALQQRVPLRG